MKIIYESKVIYEGSSKNYDFAIEGLDESKLEFIFSTEEKKLNTNYNGISVSLTSKDAVALLQVQAAFALGVPNTNIKFANGTVMPMTAEDFPAFATWFANERNKFFV